MAFISHDFAEGVGEGDAFTDERRHFANFEAGQLGELASLCIREREVARDITALYVAHNAGGFLRFFSDANGRFSGEERRRE